MIVTFNDVIINGEHVDSFGAEIPVWKSLDDVDWDTLKASLEYNYKDVQDYYKEGQE